MAGATHAKRRVCPSGGPTPWPSSSPPATWPCIRSTGSGDTSAWCDGRWPGAERDYLLLEYAGGDRLYVPSDQVGVVAKYVGGEAPRLHRLGSSDWVKAKGESSAGGAGYGGRPHPPVQRQVVGTRVRVRTGYAWQRELEEAFPYVETRDQLAAIDEVKQDMERPRRWTGCSAATSATARPRSPSGPPSRR